MNNSFVNMILSFKDIICQNYYINTNAISNIKYFSNSIIVVGDWLTLQNKHTNCLYERLELINILIKGKLFFCLVQSSQGISNGN